MTTSLTVRQVLNSPHPFQQGKFSLAVMGLLAATTEDCRIFDDHVAVDELSRAILGEGYEPDPDFGSSEDVSIRIQDPSFLSRLLAEVPAVGEHEYLYFDSAMICASTRLDPNEVVLYDVWSVILVRDGKLVRALE